MLITAPGAEQDAVAVDQEHLAVGVERAVDLRGAEPAGDAVEHDRDAFGWMNCVVSPAPMLNVFQLMIALWLDWLTVTLAVPGPWTSAAPPTTVRAVRVRRRAGASASGSSAVVVSRRVAEARRHRSPSNTSRRG